jgi:hypothetical protein
MARIARLARAPRLTGAVITAAVVLAAGALTAGCDALGSTSSGAGGSSSSNSGGAHSATKAFTVSDQVTAVVIDGGAGSVSVTGSSRSSVAVSQHLSYSSKAPTASHSLHGTTLTMSYACPTELLCSVSYQVQVPRDVTVSVTTRAGSVTLDSLAGRVSAQADAGLISASGLRSAVASFKTDAGGINAGFAAAPASLSAVTDVGPIALTVPKSARYRVSAHTVVGASTVTVPVASSSAHSITARSDLGVISIGPA